MRHGALWLSIAVVAGCGGGTDGPTSPLPGAGDADGGVVADGGGSAPDGDAFASAPICTSGATWTRGNHGSSQMNPGRACIACHSTMDGPPLTIAGTIYPTGHEPDLCQGADGSKGILLEITGADGKTLMLTPGASGNFETGTSVKFPVTAKVTYMGRTRAMTAAQASGDCNGCHTQAGANGAPGRIALP